MSAPSALHGSGLSWLALSVLGILPLLAGLAPAPTPAQGTAPQHAEPQCTSLLCQEPDGSPRVGFDVLAGFDYEKGKDLPATVTRFHKKRVSVGGFMEREFPGSGPVEFFLIINDACGCTGSPKLNEVVFCATPKGKTTHLRPGLVTVTGTLYVKEQVEMGEVIAVYAMDVDTINGDKLQSDG